MQFHDKKNNPQLELTLKVIIKALALEDFSFAKRSVYIED
jgi:hypothetical protein